MGVGFLTGRTSGDPDADRIGGGALSKDFGIYDLAQTLKHFRIAEETRDIDQNVTIQSLHFLRPAMEKFDVVAEITDLIDVHAPQDATPNRGHFVIDKIDLAEALERTKDLF